MMPESSTKSGSLHRSIQNTQVQQPLLVLIYPPQPSEEHLRLIQADLSPKGFLLPTPDAVYFDEVETCKIGN